MYFSLAVPYLSYYGTQHQSNKFRFIAEIDNVLDNSPEPYCESFRDYKRVSRTMYYVLIHVHM